MLNSEAWKKILFELFWGRFNSVLNKEEILRRVEYVLSHFSEYSAQQLYKNCVLCSRRTVIAELALDYAVRFVDHFENTFNAPSSCEIDDNNLINEEDRAFLLKTVNDQMIIFNDYVESVINCGFSDDDYNICAARIGEHFNVPVLPDVTEFWIGDYKEINGESIEIRHYLTVSQAVYAAVFGINPINNQAVSKRFVEHVSTLYPHRMKMMQRFKEVHPTGTQYTSLI